MRLPLLLVAALALTAHANDPKISFERYKLKNGLEVILAPDPATPLVAVDVWYHVGSGYEVAGKSGFAHLFEHMMFQGSKHTGADGHFKILRAVGAISGSDVNGTTNMDRTNYYEVLPSNQLETALWLESDRMGHLLEMVDKASLDNQIDVVRNEKRQRYDNVPYNVARFAMQAALYPEGHPYRYFTIGKHEDLVNASVDDVKNFFRTWYVPANATITLAGDFDPATAKQLIEKWFGSMPASTKPVVVPVPAPVVAAKRLVVDDPFAKLRQITFAFHSPASYSPGDAELDIISEALCADGPGRLYKALVYNKQLAQSVRCDQNNSKFSGVFTATVQLRSDADLAQVEKLALDELAKVAREKLTDREIARVVARKESRAIYRFEALGSRADTLQEYNHYLGDPAGVTADLDRYRTATADKILAAAAKYLDQAHMITVVTIPVETKQAGGK